jgi:hypothetical protein
VVSLCLLLLAGVTGCQKKAVKDLVIDPEFSRFALSNSTLAVGVMTNNIGGRDLDTAFTSAWGNRLRAALKEKVQYCSIADAGYFSSLVEEARCEELMRTFHNRHQLAPADLAELHQAIGEEPIFLICGSFVSGSVNQTRDSNPDSTTNTSELIFKTQRRLEAKFRVYDLQKELLVWDGLVTDAASSKNFYQVAYSYEDDDGSFWSFLGDLFGIGDDEPEEQTKFEFPDPPTFDEVAAKVVIEFARYMLPEKG